MEEEPQPPKIQTVVPRGNEYLYGPWDRQLFDPLQRNNGIEPPDCLTKDIIPPGDLWGGICGFDYNVIVENEQDTGYSNLGLSIFSKESDITRKDSDVRINNGEVPRLQQVDFVQKQTDPLFNQQETGDARKSASTLQERFNVTSMYEWLTDETQSDLQDEMEFQTMISTEEDLLNVDVSSEAHILDNFVKATADCSEIPCFEEMSEHKDSGRLQENLLLNEELFTLGGKASLLNNTVGSTQSKNPSNDISIEPIKHSQNAVPLNIIANCKKGSCDTTGMFVRTSNNGKKDKRLCCLYCNKTYISLARHLETVHKNEPDVQKFCNLPKGSMERRAIQDVLRKSGNSIWNTNANLNNGELITSRRPNIELNKSATDYSTCPYCVGTYTKNNMRHHVKKCSKIPMKGQRIIQVLGRTIEGRLHAKASDQLRLVVFPVLREDTIIRLIRYDWILIVYGNKLCTKYVPQYQHNMIRARLRLSGRLLYAIKSLHSEVTDFSSIFNPKFYDKVIEAIRVVAQFDPPSNEFKSPATAASAVTQLRQIGLILIAEYIKREEPENQKRTENFLTLMRADIGITINKSVTETQSKMRRQKKENIPTTEDIRRLSMYLDIERKQCYDALSAEYSFNIWLKLLELTMASIIVFNRRRTGEIQNTMWSDFIGRESINETTNVELYKSLSDKSKEVAKKFSRMKIRGKKGRTVPVLLNPDVEKCLELITHHRKEAQIQPQNEYLFAIPSNDGKTKVADACQILRKFSECCGAIDPHSLRGTSLRKHMATICISLELTDNLVAEVADFMGHHEKVHRDYYRNNTIDREVVKISQLLEAAQGKNNGNDDTNDGQNRSDAPHIYGSNRHYKTTHEGTDLESSVSDILGNDSEADPEYVPEDVLTLQSKRKRAVVPLSESDESEGGGAVIGRGSIPKKKFTKRRWNPEELTAVYKAFGPYFRSKTLPSTKEILKQQKLHEPLRNRTWMQIKAWIQNQYKKPKGNVSLPSKKPKRN